MPFYYQLPQLTDMTPVQQSVLDQPLPVAISGGPGTGKSVVSIWRHIRNHELGTQKSLLLTYAKTLRFVLAAAANIEHGVAGQHVETTFDWITRHNPFSQDYDEMIIDEAQDVSSDRYETLKGLTAAISYGADDEQMLYPGQQTTEAQLRELFPANRHYTLDQNHRNTYEVMHFVKAALPNRLISNNVLDRLRVERSTGRKPQCILTGGTHEGLIAAIKSIVEQFQEETHNIGILLPLTTDVDRMHSQLLDAGVNCTKYHFKCPDITLIENVHVTTFKSSKGIEFDTVIIPKFGAWRENIASLDVVGENDYYVAFTRAKRNLYLLCDAPLIGISADTFDIT